MSDTPRLYVSCLAAYNAGIHHGKWIDVDDADSVWDEIREILRTSPCPNVVIDCPKCEDSDTAECSTCKGSGQVASSEEWQINDHEGFQGYDVGRYGSIDDACAIAELIEQFGDAFKAAISYFDASEVQSVLTDRYHGVWSSAADYAAEYAEDSGALANVPESLQWCINWDAYAESLDVVSVRTSMDECHIFSRY